MPKVVGLCASSAGLGEWFLISFKLRPCLEGYWLVWAKTVMRSESTTISWWISHQSEWPLVQPLITSSLFLFSDPSRPISSIFRKRHKSSVTAHDWCVMANFSCNSSWTFLTFSCYLLRSLKPFLCKIVSHFLGLADSHCSHTHDLVSGSIKICFI